jgi:archaellum component FlaC
LTEKKYNNLNISSFSTYNKFYTEFNNKYSNLLTEINIQNNNLENLTQFVYNNRNNITNIKRFNNTYRTSEFKSTINVFKTEKKIINEEDYFFKQAVLKTFTLSNQITKIKIDQVKDQINNVKNNVSFIKHDVVKIKNYNKEYRLNEFKKIINILKLIKMYPIYS